MLSKIFTTVLRTKSIFLQDKEGEEEAPACRAKDVRKLCEMGNLLFWFQNKLLGGEKTPLQLMQSALFNLIQENESKQNPTAQSLSLMV